MSTSRDMELLSAHLDGEVPEPWRSRMDRFIASSAERQAGFERLKSVKTKLHSESPIDYQGAQDRVWNQLQQRITPAKPRILTSAHWWEKAVSVPLPAAAAVVITVFAFGVFAFRGPGRPDPGYDLARSSELFSGSPVSFDSGGLNSPNFRPVMDNQIGSDLQLRVQVDSIAQLLEILAAQNVVRDITINLPQESQFSIYGEPALMRASDVNSRGVR
ncbi:anti-sigma factor family protein [Spirochaeta dissipatitropha]